MRHLLVTGLLLASSLLAGCVDEDPDVVVEDVGVTSLWVLNDSAGAVEVAFVVVDPYQEPNEDVTIETATIGLVTEGWGIGGGLQVPEVVSSITVRDVASGDVLLQQGPSDFDGWERAPDSTWEDSQYTLTIR